MTAAEYRAALSNIGWTPHGLARRLTNAGLSVSGATTRRWAEDAYPVPDDVAAWLRRLQAAHRRWPGPGVRVGAQPA